jgi:hypothetical protein
MTRMQRRRQRKRRWRCRSEARTSRAARHGRGIEAPPAPLLGAPRVIEKEGFRLQMTAEGLRVVADDYHCPPLHLSTKDLADLGLALDDRVAPPSVALQWTAKMDLPADRLAQGPASDPAWVKPEGLQVRDFLVCRVTEGIDVFVTSYSASPAILSASQASQLGLSPTGRRRETKLE